MAEHAYLDFELEIIRRRRDNYGATARWEGGRGEHTFSLPFSDDELQRLDQEIDSERDAEKWGRRLFDAVFAGNVRICLENCQSRARFQQAGLRMKLHLGDVPQLATLPWEYLFNPTTHSFFALAAETPIVRFVDMLHRNPVLPIQPPLRILAMISSPIDQPEALNVEREEANLRKALGSLADAGKVVLDVEEDANLGVLQNKLLQAKNEGQGYHIFHFVGHGQFEEEEGEGLLLLEDEEERSRSVSGRRLGTYLFGHHTLRLAVLNACEGARASATRPFGSVAKTLVQRGIPAVVAMRVQISDQAAIDFARQFYTAIAAGWPVDAALAEGRKAIYADSEVEWATPLLYMGVADGRVFDLSGAIGPVEEPAPAVEEPTSLPEEWPVPSAEPSAPPSAGDAEDALDIYRDLGFAVEQAGVQPVPQVGGVWQNVAIGGGISIVQNGQMLNVTEYNAFGAATGQGAGQVVGRQLHITIQNYVLGVMVSAQLELAPDGMTLYGVISMPGVPPTSATFVLQH